MNITSKPIKQEYDEGKNIKDEDIFVDSEGRMIDKEYVKLSKILYNKSKYFAQNAVFGDYSEDLYQEAWCKIIKEIPGIIKRHGVVTTSYAVKTGENAMRYYIRKRVIKHQEILDIYNNEIFNEEMNANQDRFQLNTEKAKLEFSLSKDYLPLEDSVSLRVSIENIILNLPKDDRRRNLLLIKYIKEFEGRSEVLLKEYQEFYEKCDKEKQDILNSMDAKFTHNKAYQCLGIRSTDNCTTQIRKGIKSLLADLKFYSGERQY